MKREDLLNQLQTVSPALATIDLIPIMTHFWFADDRIVAYNDAIAIDTATEANLRCAIPGKLTLELLSNSFANDVKLELDKDRLFIEAGSSRIKLPILDPETYEAIWPN